MREKITSAVFCVLLAAFFVVVMLCPKDEQASVLENRELAELPKITWENYFDGSFGPAYESYLTDNVGYRSSLVRFGTSLEKIRGLFGEKMGQIVALSDGKELVLDDGKIMEVYRKNEETMEHYIKVLNRYSKNFDTNMYLMVVPTQIEFSDSKYKEISDSEKETIDEIYESVNGYKTVNVYDALKENSDDYIYFRTDHHWTQRGAYLGYKALMEEKGAEPVKLEDAKARRVSGFLGYLYNQANVPEYKKYADDIEYFEFGENYKITAKGKSGSGDVESYTTKLYCYPGEDDPKYDIFLGGNHGLCEIKTNVKNGETALIIKDSYGNVVIPFLTQNYERIFVVDPRMFGSSIENVVGYYDVDDIIFINYIFSTTFDDFIDYMSEVMK